MSMRLAYFFAAFAATILVDLVSSAVSLPIEMVKYDMNHENISSLISDFEHMSSESCSGNLDYKTVGKCEDSSGTKFEKSLRPYAYVSIEVEFAVESSASGHFQIRLNGNDFQQISIANDFLTVTNEELCGIRNYSKFSRKQIFVTAYDSSPEMEILQSNQNHFAIYSYRVFVQLCNATCERCSSTNPNQCTQCDNNSPNNGKCYCDSDEFYKGGNCEDSDNSCDSNYELINKKCVYIANCEDSDSSGNEVCKKCDSGYYLSRGVCLKACSHEQTANGGKCDNKYATYPTSPVEHLVEFYSDAFSSKFVEDAGVTFVSSISQTFSSTSLCGTLQLILGNYNGGMNSEIHFPQRTISENNLYLSFKAIIIDPATVNPNSADLTILINGAEATQKTELITTLPLCGQSTDDMIAIITLTYPLASAGTNVVIQIQNQRPDGFMGIREVYILGFNCSANCSACTIDACTACAAGFTVNATTKECDPCINGIIIGNICEPCFANCSKCTGTGEFECTECLPTAQMIGGNTCQPCVIGKFMPSGPGGFCQDCDSSCSQCQTTSKTCVSCSIDYYVVDGACVKCLEENALVLVVSGATKTCEHCDPSCKTCTGTETTQCKTCEPEGFYLTVDTECNACQQANCKICENETGNCTKCTGTMKFMPDGSCQECSVDNKFYISNEQCLPCHASCKTCSGPNADQCKTCDDAYTLDLKTNLCMPCSNIEYLDSTKGECLQCLNQCTVCSSLNSKGSSIIECQYCSCKVCKDNLPIFQEKCVSSCSAVGVGFVRNPSTNICECPSNLPKLIQIETTYHCVDTVPFGYFCPASGGPCVQCRANCQTCASETKCSYCGSGFYFWNEDCIPSCFPEYSIIANDKARICQCEDGKQLKQRDAEEIANSNSKEPYQCLNPLKFDMIEVINALSKPSSREGIPDVILNNYFILTYNRRPTEDEYATFNFYLMKDILTPNVEYMVMNTVLEHGKRSILVEVKMLENRKITFIVAMIDTLIDRINLDNVVLVSESFSKELGNDSSQSVSGGMESLADGMTNSDSEFVNTLIAFSKQFQIVCSLSNFVQLLTPIYFLNHALPPLIKYGSLLGAAFIYKEIPSQQSVDFTQEAYSRRARMLQEEKESVHNMQSMLSGFGLTSNIFDGFIGVHLMVFFSVILIAICYIGRKAFNGKQYTMIVADKIANLVTSSLQSSITMILSMVAYCFIVGEGLTLAVIYLLCYSIIYLQTLYLTLFKSVEYLHTNIPNFFIDINYRLKGAKWYLLMSLVKKHAAIAILIMFYKRAMLCCILISVLFFVSGAILAYFRFFTKKLITIAKVFQEFAVSSLFALLTYTVNVYATIMEKDIISNEEMNYTVTLATVVLVFIVICIVTSFCFSSYRLVITLSELFDAIKKYRQERNKQTFNDPELLDTTTIQMSQGLTQMYQVKVFTDISSDRNKKLSI